MFALKDYKLMEDIVLSQINGKHSVKPAECKKQKFCFGN